MKTRSHVSRAWIVMALLGFVLVIPVVVLRVSASASGPSVVVFGDSITARYNNKAGDAKQGWWSFVGRQYGVPMTTYAESGSGFQRPGHACTGTIFADRLKKLKNQPPRAVFVEGGRNDWAHCNSHHKAVVATNGQIQRGVDSFLTGLQNAIPATTKVYVLGPPWGSKDSSQRARVTAIVKASAESHSMIFISTDGVFTSKRVLDGIHPNRAGSIALGDTVIQGIGSTLP